MSTMPKNDTDAFLGRDRSRFAKGLLSTVPIVLVGSMAMSLNLTGPVSASEPEKPERQKASPSQLGESIRASLAAAHAASTAEATSSGAIVTTAAAPASYTVVAGDTISGIAGRFGLATASVLGMNGLGWKSVIFPGQTLKLGSAAATPAPAQAAPVASASRYTIVAGDTVGRIAARFGVPSQAVLTANGLSATSIIYAGGSLAIPGATGPASVTAAPLAPSAPRPTAQSGPKSHVIGSGQTISSIASTYGVSIQAILSANGLSWSSIIYSGRSLVIPSSAPVATSAPASAAPASSTSSRVEPLTAEMTRNAQSIIAVGKSLGVSDYGLVIALAAAMQESSLRNLDYGDRDSLGLFQQRPSTGWGTPEQVTDPTHAARLFFGGPSNPNRGYTRGLLDISGWQSKSVTDAAQAVQLSGHPGAYAKWEVSARAWLAQLT